MDTAPPGLNCKGSHDIHVDETIRYKVDVQSVHLVELKYPQPAKLGPAAFNKRQEIIPPLPGVFDVEHFLESERPHVERLLAQGFRGEQISGFGLLHSLVCGVVCL